MRARQLWFTAPGAVELREAEIGAPNEDAGELLVEAELCGVSAGTESLLWRGEFPEGLLLDESLPALKRSADYPCPYGYAMAGRAAGRDNRVLAFAPHGDRAVVQKGAWFDLPGGWEAERGILLPNTETALNLVLDAAPRMGERIVVFGLGVVGLITLMMLSEFPLERLVGVDPAASRRERAGEALGWMGVGGGSGGWADSGLRGAGEGAGKGAGSQGAGEGAGLGVSGRGAGGEAGLGAGQGAGGADARVSCAGGVGRSAGEGAGEGSGAGAGLGACLEEEAVLGVGGRGVGGRGAGEVLLLHPEELAGDSGFGEFDGVVEVSGRPEALGAALGAAGYDGRIVVGSWYGGKTVNLDLGLTFHRRRLRIVSSQVSTIAPGYRGRWDYRRRMTAAISWLDKNGATSWVTHRIPLENAQTAYEMLDAGADHFQIALEP